jgi:hypothetical protein
MLLVSRLRYHHCFGEGGAGPSMTNLERLMLV